MECSGFCAIIWFSVAILGGDLISLSASGIGEKSLFTNCRINGRISGGNCALPAQRRYAARQFEKLVEDYSIPPPANSFAVIFRKVFLYPTKESDGDYVEVVADANYSNLISSAAQTFHTHEGCFRRCQQSQNILAGQILLVWGQPEQLEGLDALIRMTMDLSGYLLNKLCKQK